MRSVLRQIRVLVVAAAGLSGSLAMAADPDHGSDLAKRWCAACHVVDGDQKQANTDARLKQSRASRTLRRKRSPSSCSTRTRRCRIFR